MDDRTAQFVDKLINRNIIHNTKPVVLKTGEIYTSHRNKLTFICAVGHEWIGIPVNIIRGASCPVCDKTNRSIKQTNTHERFLQQLHTRNINNPTSPVYVAVGQQYLGMCVKLSFECNHRHTWLAKPNNVLTNNSGCPTCRKLKAGARLTTTQSEFLEQLQNRNIQYPYKLIFLLTGEIYKSRKEKLSFRCNKNHVWSTSPDAILSGSGCPICGTQLTAQKRAITHEEFLNRLANRNLEYNDKPAYLYKDQKYTNNKIKLKFTCDKGHVWTSLPDNTIRGSGCPICARKTFSQVAINWINSVELKDNIKIQTALSECKEYRIPGTKFKVDGFCKETNTVYEFYGDYWHGNPKIYNPLDTNKVNYKPFGVLYTNTIQRETKIRKLGYNIVTMWESDYR